MGLLYNRILTVVILLALITSIFSLSTKAEIGLCKDVLIVFARGSGQNGPIESTGSYKDAGVASNETQSKLFFDEIDKRIKNLSVENISLHDFAGKYNNYGYGAVDAAKVLDRHPDHRTDVNTKYAESVKDGAEELVGYLQDKLTTCPNQQVILGGYSQGAHVIGDALFMLPDQYKSNIAYAAFYGDPKFNPRTSTLPLKSGWWARGSAHSYQSGALLPRKQYLANGITNAGSWCDSHDPVCAGLLMGYGTIPTDLSDIFISKVHNNNYQNKWIPQSANEIANSLKTINKFANNIQLATFNDTTSPSGPTDFALVLDTTNSMDDEDMYIKQQRDQFAQALLSIGTDTRVAIVGFNDYTPTTCNDSYNSKVLIPFSQSKTDISKALYDFVIGCGDDEPEAQFSGLMTAMNNLQWRVGVQKKILVITNSPPHSPDLGPEHWTKEQVIKRALELDPVSISFVSFKDYYGNYPKDVEANVKYISGNTNGLKVLTSYWWDQRDVYKMLNSMKTLPVAVANASTTSGRVGQLISFSGGDAYDPDGVINKYEWDFNNDGVWDSTSSNPVTDYTYSSIYSGLAVLQVTAIDGTSTKAILNMNISDSIGSPALPPVAPVASTQNPRVTDTATISWSNDYPAETVVRITDCDDNVLGYSANNNFALNGLEDSSICIKLAASNENGWGESATLTIPNRLYPPATPITNYLRQGLNTQLYWQNEYLDNVAVNIHNIDGQKLESVYGASSWAYLNSPVQTYSLKIGAQNEAGESELAVIEVPQEVFAPTAPQATAYRDGNNVYVHWSNGYNNDVTVSVYGESETLLGQSNNGGWVYQNTPINSFTLGVIASNIAGSSEPTVLNIDQEFFPPEAPAVSYQRVNRDLILTINNDYPSDVLVTINGSDGQIMSQLMESNTIAIGDVSLDAFSLSLVASNLAGASDPTTINIPQVIADKDLPDSESNPNWLNNPVNQVVAVTSNPTTNSQRQNNFVAVDNTAPQTSSAEASKPITDVRGAQNVATAQKIDARATKGDQIKQTLFVVAFILLIWFLLRFAKNKISN